MVEGAQKSNRQHIKREERTDTIPYQVKIDKKNILIRLSPEHAYKEVDVYVGGDYLLSATASKKSMIKVTKYNKIGRIILKAVQAGEALEVRGSS